jgi:hypothetical protein
VYLITASTEAEAEDLLRDVTGEDSDSLHCLLGAFPPHHPTTRHPCVQGAHVRPCLLLAPHARAALAPRERHVRPFLRD